MGIYNNNDKARTYPYACVGNGLQLVGFPRLAPSDYKAEYNITVAAGGGSVTITPVSGNTDANLKSYKAQIFAKEAPQVAFGSLDLGNPANPFVIDTSVLDASKDWVLRFFASKQGSTEIYPAEIYMDIIISKGTIAAGATDLKVRLPLYTYEAENILRPVSSVTVNGNESLAPSDDIAGLTATVEGALNAAGESFTSVTVVDGTPGTFTVTIEGTTKGDLVITAQDGNPATVSIPLK